MQTLLGLLLLERSPAADHIDLMIQIIPKHLYQIERHRLSVDQTQKIDGKAGPQLRMLQKIVQHKLRHSRPLQLHNNPNSITVRLIADIGHIQLLLLSILGNIRDQICLIDLIRNLRKHQDRLLAILLDRIGSFHLHTATANLIGLTIQPAENRRSCWKIRSLNNIQQLRYFRITAGQIVVDHTHSGIQDFPQIVRRNIAGHTDSNTLAAVHQQIRKPAGQHFGLLHSAIKIRRPINRVLIDIPQHLVRNTSHTGLRITIRGRRIAIHGTKVPVAVDQRIPHREILGQTSQRIINTSITMRVIMTNHITDRRCTLLIRHIVRQAGPVHRIQNPAMYRLKPVTNIRQGTGHNHAHRVIDVALAHDIRQTHMLIIRLYNSRHSILFHLAPPYASTSAYAALSSMYRRRGTTDSPISVTKRSSVSNARSSS